jgi:hypothetical protein
MPLKWEPGKNPYLHNHFGVLRVGPSTTRAQIVAQAKKLVLHLAAGQALELAAYRLDEHAVKHAESALGEPAGLAEELLLVHPQPQRTGKDRLKAALAELRQIPAPCSDRRPPPLRHPLALFEFLPAPGPEAAELPPWEAFGLVTAGDTDDLALDIVFDS